MKYLKKYTLCPYKVLIPVIKAYSREFWKNKTILIIYIPWPLHSNNFLTENRMLIFFWQTKYITQLDKF